MQIQRVIAVVLVAAGLMLVFLGYQSSQGMDDQVTQAITGDYTDRTVWYWLVGGAAVLAGFFMLMRQR